MPKLMFNFGNNQSKLEKLFDTGSRRQCNEHMPFLFSSIAKASLQHHNINKSSDASHLKATILQQRQQQHFQQQNSVLSANCF